MANKKKFFRDGARYVCANCKKKYFTKVEVEDCYDKCIKMENAKKAS